MMLGALSAPSSVTAVEDTSAEENPNITDALPRRVLSSYFFSPSYLSLARAPDVFVQHGKDDNSFRVIAVTEADRKRVLCYYPVVVRRKSDHADMTYALSIQGRKSASHVFVCDLPLSADMEDFAPVWRGKAVIGHLVRSTPIPDECNARLEFLTSNASREGAMTYLAVVAKRRIAGGEEVRMDFGRVSDHA